MRVKAPLSPLKHLLMSQPGAVPKCNMRALTTPLS